MGIGLFAFIAVLAVLAALLVVLHPDPVYSALGLIAVMCLLAVLFVSLEAPVLAAFQIIVYAGAVMVLFLFVVMLLGQSLAGGSWAARPGLWIAGGGAAAAFGAALASVVLGERALGGALAPPKRGFGSAETLAGELFTTHLLSFELTSVLLLIAVVGAVVLAKERFERRAPVRDPGVGDPGGR